MRDGAVAPRRLLSSAAFAAAPSSFPRGDPPKRKIAPFCSHCGWVDTAVAVHPRARRLREKARVGRRLRSVDEGRHALVRVAYRVSFLLFVASGKAAAWLAFRFRALARTSQRWGGLVVPLQIPVLVAWVPARAISLVAFALCEALAPKLS